MLPDLVDLLSSDNSAVLHWVIFISLVLGGFGFPIPEDIPLIIAGVVFAKGVVSLPTIVGVCYAGVVIADLIIYGVGYKFGPRLLSYGTRSPFLPSVTPERVERVRDGLRQKRFLYIFLGRHLFPLRSVTFLTAGALGIPFLEFLVSDLIAAMISVSIMMTIGFFLGEALTPEMLEHIGKEIHWYGMILTIIVCLIFTLKYLHKKRAKKQI